MASNLPPPPHDPLGHLRDCANEHAPKEELMARINDPTLYCLCGKCERPLPPPSFGLGRQNRLLRNCAYRPMGQTYAQGLKHSSDLDQAIAAGKDIRCFCGKEGGCSG